MQRIFVADVGGTNCRFGSFILEHGTLVLEFSARISSSSLGSGQALFAALSEALSQPIDNAAAVVVGLAGPVDGQKGRLTNGSLTVDLAAVPALRHIKCLLLNDFTLQAYATLMQPGTDALCVAGSPAEKCSGAADSQRHAEGPAGNGLGAGSGTGTRGIIGAGTGLGAASLLAADGEWVPVPSEAGHVAFAFLGDEEQEYRRFLCKELRRPFVSAENVLCGEGLALLQYYLTGQKLAPAQVGEQALACDTPTLQWYARFLGRFCRGWMLSTLCTGGLWIAGGIAAANPLCVTSPVFAEALRSCPGDIPSILQHTPVYLVRDTDSGLWGAAFAGQVMLQQKSHVYSMLSG